MAYRKTVKDILIDNKETVAHMKRCARIARRFAIFLDLSTNQIKILERCALLHDIGKLFLPSDILYKKGKLTNEEFEVIKSHVLINIPEIYDKEIQETVKYHHERPDGRGYLKIDYNSLSMYTKIVTLIDVYDVMKSCRCYKENISGEDEIIAELKGNLNIQFDKQYGELFLEFLQNGNNYTQNERNYAI